jgi:hypothetical protein
MNWHGELDYPSQYFDFMNSMTSSRGTSGILGLLTTQGVGSLALFANPPSRGGHLSEQSHHG